MSEFKKVKSIIDVGRENIKNVGFVFSFNIPASKCNVL